MIGRLACALPFRPAFWPARWRAIGWWHGHEALRDTIAGGVRFLLNKVRAKP